MIAALNIILTLALCLLNIWLHDTAALGWASACMAWIMLAGERAK